MQPLFEFTNNVNHRVIFIKEHVFDSVKTSFINRLNDTFHKVFIDLSESELIELFKYKSKYYKLNHMEKDVLIVSDFWEYPKPLQTRMVCNARHYNIVCLICLPFKHRSLPPVIMHNTDLIINQITDISILL